MHRAVIVPFGKALQVEGELKANDQTFHPTVEAARRWAKAVLTKGHRAEIYEIKEVLVETLNHD